MQSYHNQIFRFTVHTFSSHLKKLYFWFKFFTARSFRILLFSGASLAINFGCIYCNILGCSCYKRPLYIETRLELLYWYRNDYFLELKEFFQIEPRWFRASSDCFTKAIQFVLVTEKQCHFFNNCWWYFLQSCHKKVFQLSNFAIWFYSCIPSIPLDLILFAVSTD